jgi:hypothetical protein
VTYTHTHNAAGQPVKTHLYGFKARFVPLIRSGAKQQTIRAERKRMPISGDRMRLQHGPRFKPALIGFAVADLVEPVRIHVEAGGIVLGADRETRTTAADLDQFAVWDGFGDWADMRAFWRAEHPSAEVFTGFRTFWGTSLVLA